MEYLFYWENCFAGSYQEKEFVVIKEEGPIPNISVKLALGRSQCEWQLCGYVIVDVLG